MMRRRLPSRQNPADGLVACIDAQGDAGGNPYTMLKSVGQTASMWSMALIPSLVALYEWLYDCQGYVLTEEAAQNTTMEQLFQSLSYVPCVRVLCVLFV